MAQAIAQEVERVREAGAETETVRPAGLSYPADVFSLSHIAVPFPPSDGLYGWRSDPNDDFGMGLGALAQRGERGVLITSLDVLLRQTCNPFFDYMAQRIAEGLPAKR